MTAEDNKLCSISLRGRPTAASTATLVTFVRGPTGDRQYRQSTVVHLLSVGRSAVEY